ncbi:MAG TPA: hypothetical protein VF139_16600 [Candidatus Polarisedimenticolaceae bacterium]
MIRDCASFESVLAEALAEGPGAAPSVLADLRAHAGGCEACRPSLPLVAMAALPAADRDPLPEPTERDWERFDRRLRSRLDAETSRGWTWAGAAVAATVAGALLGAWLLRAPEVPLIAEGPKPAASDPEVANPPVKPPEKRPADEPSLDSFARDAWSALALGDDDEVEPVDGPFPDLDKLDEKALERLERWLDEEEARLSPRGDA